MKKLLGCFLCVMLLFCLSSQAAADMLVYDIDPPDLSSYWIGSDTNGQTLPDSGDLTEETWLNYLLGNDGSGDWVDIDKLGVIPGDGDYIGGFTNGYAVLKYGNGTGGAMDLYGFSHWAIQDDGDGILELYNISNPYFGEPSHPLSSYEFIDLGEIALSHVNAAPAPEPTTMLLLGTGLVGLAGFGRKKFRKQ